MTITIKKSFIERIKVKFERYFSNPQYGSKWEKDNIWYNKIHNSNPLIHKNFIEFYQRNVKILGEGNLSKKLTVKAHRFSKSAIQKINQAGGQIEEIKFEKQQESDK